MKVKTSITLSPSTLEALDEMVGPASSRSHVIETAVIEFIARRRRRVREAKDLRILNRSADHLNREIEEILAFQIEP